MDPQISQPDESETYLASYEASNRKRKILIISAAIVATIVAVGAFVVTLGSLGRMSEDVQGAFSDENDKAGDKTNPEAAAPKAETETDGQSAPAETSTPTADGSAEPAEAAPSEANP